MASPGDFFIFSKFWFSWLLGGRVKGQKMAQNDKKLCLTPYLWNHTSYDGCFLVHMCKMMISLAFFFFIFSKFGDSSRFSKFINKYQKEILRCAPPSSYVCEFFYYIDLLLFLNLLELSVMNHTLYKRRKIFVPRCLKLSHVLVILQLDGSALLHSWDG